MLSDQVKQLEERYALLKLLAGELLATVRLNWDKGYLNASSKEAKNTFERFLSNREQMYEKIQKTEP